MLYKRVPTQIIVAAFNCEKEAQVELEAAAKAMVEMDDAPICTNAVTATKSLDGKTKVTEYGKPNMLQGFVGGTMIGGAAGAAVGGAALSILGPIGVATGAIAGGAVGAPLGAINGTAVGAIGKWTVEGMDKKKLDLVRDALEPGTSALILVFGEVLVKKSALEGGDMKDYKTFTDKLAKALMGDISHNLKQGRNCAHLLSVTEDGVSMDKVMVGDDVFQLTKLVMTSDADAVAEFKATLEGAACATTVATDDAIFSQGAVVNKDAAVAYQFAATTAE